MTGRIIAAIAAAAAFSGCRREEEPAVPAGAPAAEANAIEQVKERGPVKVILRVAPKEPTFADRVRFTIEASARKGVEVTLPKPGESLEGFLIKDYDVPPPRTTADGTEIARSYILEFVTSGEFKIPPQTIVFKDLRPRVDEAGKDAAEKPGEKPEEDKPAESLEYRIVTDEIPIIVKPLADPESLKELAGIEGQADPPPIPRGLAWLLWVAGALTAWAAIAFAALRILRRKRLPPPPIPPHERAYRDLEWLLGQGFVDRGELKEFFFHLSRILREYIENRFGLRAPELTTEEFLAVLGGSGGGGAEISSGHRSLLRDFLCRADLVKFARYAPGKEEIEESFEAAKRFIEATLPAASTAPVAAEAVGTAPGGGNA